MAENGENATAVPPNSETNTMNTVVETSEIMESLPSSEISQGNENNAMDIVSMALSNVTETANLMTVVDSNVVVTEEEVQQFEQVEVVEQQVVQEIPIGSEDMVITTSDGQIILPANSTPAELSAVETLVGGALQQTVLSQHQTHPIEQSETQSQHVQDLEEATVVSAVPMTLTSSVPVVDSSNPTIVNIGSGGQDISASTLLGSIATMIDSTESSIHHDHVAGSGGNSSSLPALTGMKINTVTSAPTNSNIVVTRTLPANNNNVNLVGTSVQASAGSSNNIVMSYTSPTPGTTSVTTMGLNSVITSSPSQSSSLPSTITIKTPPGSNSVSQSLLNSILNNSDVQSLLKRNPGQPITIVRVPEDSPGGKNVNKITVTTGTPATKKPVFQPSQAAKTYMRITTPTNKSGIIKSSSAMLKSQTNTPNNSNPKRRPGRPPKVKELPPEPVVVKSKKTRSGRVSRPPIHRVRDYKTIHIQEMGEPDDEKDDFTDYDGELLKNAPIEFSPYGGRARAFKCDKCDKAYIGKAGLGRHFKNNPDHGDPAELGITYDEEDEKTPSSVHVTPVPTVQTPPFRRKRRGRPPGPRPPNGDPDFHPNKRIPSKMTTGANLGAQALYRRKQRIQELIDTIGVEDLMELALPRLSKAITVWEFLLMKVEETHSQKLPFQEILQQFESVRKHVRLFADECLERVAAKSDKQGEASTSAQSNAEETKTTATSSEARNSDEVQTDRDTSDMVQTDKDKSVDSQTGKDKPDDEQTRKDKSDGVQADTDKSDSVHNVTDKSDDVQTGKDKSGDLQADKDKSDEVQTDKDKSGDLQADKDKSDEVQTDKDKSGDLQADKDKSDEVQTDKDTSGSQAADEQSKKENEQSPSEDVASSEIKEKTALSNHDDDTTEPLASESKLKATENGEIGETVSNSKPSSESKVDDSTLRTDQGKEDVPNGEKTDSQTQKVSENSSILPSSADLKDSAAKSDAESSKDFLELDDELAKALGMEAGKYSVREWTATNKLPAFFRFSKNVTEEDSLSEDEANKDDSGPSAKRQKVNNVSEASPPVSTSMPAHTGRQITQIQLPKEETIKPPALTPATPLLVKQHTSSNYYKPATVPISLRKALPATEVTAATPTAGKQQQQQVVTTSLEPGEQVVEEPQAMEITEQSNEVTESEQPAEVTTEEVTYQTEEEGHSIVPEGSTIMQMEDGTFLVQKPDGTAMQIHCPDGMTIETIQALLSMDAGNILQSAE